MNIHQISNQDQHYDEASRWLAKMERGLTPEEKEKLQAWLGANRKNREVFLEMARLWDRLDALSWLSELFPHTAHLSVRTQWLMPAAAVSLLLAIVAGIWVAARLNAPALPGPETASVNVSNNLESVYETTVGERSSIQLPDDTLLVLNTNSRLRADYTDRQRFLVLERGEVHVDVARDEARPFIVQAGEQLIQAVGTAFNIELRSDQKIELVVTKGKVLVGAYQGPRPDPRTPKLLVLPPSSITISEGEQLTLEPFAEESVEKVEKIEPADVAVKLSWREGNLIFRGESLDDAIMEIGRYTTMEFVILDEDLKKVRVVGLFKAGDINGLLATLEQNFNITYERREEKILLESSSGE